MDFVVNDHGHRRAIRLNGRIDQITGDDLAAIAGLNPALRNPAAEGGPGAYDAVTSAPARRSSPLQGWYRGCELDRSGRISPHPYGEANAAGLIPVIRPHVALPPCPGDAPSRTTPEPVERPDPIGWSSALPALAMAVVVGWRWSWLFAAVSGLAGAIPLLRGAGAWIRYGWRRRQLRQADAVAQRAHLEAIADWARLVDHWVSAQVESPATVDAMIRGELSDRGPWFRRVDPDAGIALALGRGRHGRWSPAENIPIIVEAERGLHVAGDRAPALALARWAVAELAVRHGPADVAIALIVTPDRVPDWDWVKWLPQLHAVAVTTAEADDLLGSVTSLRRDQPMVDPTARSGSMSQRTMLVVIDGMRPDGPGAFARHCAEGSEHHYVLALGEEPMAVCDQIVEATADGWIRSLSFDSTAWHGDGAEPSSDAQVGAFGGWSWGCSRREAETIARWLAPLSDPTEAIADGGLPDRVSLAEVLEQWAPVVVRAKQTNVGVSEAIGSGAVRSGRHAWRDRWAADDRRGLWMPIGVGEHGPIVLNLDQVGPHVLVAGTTGSGKSELLRTMVVGAAMQHRPEHVSFLLIDFKGGGAFDGLTPLPHVAAVVTDLDGDEAGRALRSLRAEIRWREQLARDRAIRDLRDVSDGPARLVVVVDEFSVLAEELPAFLADLIDVARRGRSLGIHLILATQRPSGVITPDIRANTGLTLCLRVRDAMDSFDVLGSAEAAELPSIPGRLIIRVGGEELRWAQAALIDDDEAMLVPEPFHLRSDLPGSIQSQPSPASTPVGTARASSWLPEVAAAMVRCSTPARAPWLDPIPERFAAAQMWSFPISGDVVPIGAVESADCRSQYPLCWQYRDGGLIVLGVDRDAVSNTLAMAVTATALSDSAMALSDSAMALSDSATASAGSAQLGATVVVLDPDRHPRLARLELLGPVVGLVHGDDEARLAQALRFIRDWDADRDGLLVVVVHRWASMRYRIESILGPSAAGELLGSLQRHGVVPVISAESDTEIPNSLSVGVLRRLVHRVADEASSGLASGVLRGLNGSMVFDTETGLRGVVATLGDHDLARAAAWINPRSHCHSLQVLGDEMVLEGSLASVSDPARRRVVIGFDERVQPFWLDLRSGGVVIVIGAAGTGRTTTIELLRDLTAHWDAPAITMIDDVDLPRAVLLDDVYRELRGRDEQLVVATDWETARSYGGWIRSQLDDAVVIALKPPPSASELLGARIADLRSAPSGRAIVADRGRHTIVQIARRAPSDRDRLAAM